MAQKVIVALSGGVDSSVTAALLQQRGFEVSAIFMKNWSPNTLQSLTDCPWEQDQADAEAVCAHLNIPFRSINFEAEYKEQVVDYFLKEYAAGRTPNPDIMCNKEIKFKAFLQEALKLGADFIATGHYAQVKEENGVFSLHRGVDPKKDQSYFLYTLTSEQLSKTLMPLGEYTKPEVREMAQQFGLPTAAKKDSQGICFIGHIDLKKFLHEYIANKLGETRLLPKASDIPSFEERVRKSRLVGHHSGAMFYTLGERAGAISDNGMYKLIRGSTDTPPLYVVEKNGAENILFVSEDRLDPALHALKIELESWSGEDSLSPAFSYTAQARYQQQERVELESFEQVGDKWNIQVKEPLWAAAPGQSLVVYRDDTVVGGGVISAIIKRA